MKDYRKMLLISLIVALASQVNIGLINSDFRVSAGIIFFAIFLVYYHDLRPIPTGILSGIIVYVLRLLVYFLINKNLSNVIISYQLEILFYAFYAIIYSILIRNKGDKNLNYIFLITIISDFGANLIEVLVRTIFQNATTTFKVGYTLLLVSVARSAIIWLALNGIRYYKILLTKEEHENRYKRLLWLTSQLKTEMYWIEKNMDHIEKVMAESYQLFEKINSKVDEETWGDRALNIARDVHEIKKENGLVIRGIQEITDRQLNDKGMDSQDIFNILSETMKREIQRNNKDITLKLEIDNNFYTTKHYYLMSLLRNLIMNSIDAIPDTQRSAIIKVELKMVNDEYQLIVSDNGSGIDEESLKHIFSPGFSTKINYDTGEINRGLGLSIVKDIIEVQLQGKLDVSSVLRKGTKFIITIPRKALEGEE